jgi:hypothetical protein
MMLSMPYLARTLSVYPRHRALDDHQHARVHRQRLLDGVLHSAGVEEVVLIIVVGGRGDDHQLRGTVGRGLVHGGGELQLPLPRLRLGKEALDLVVLDRLMNRFSFSALASVVVMAVTSWCWASRTASDRPT